MEFMMKLNQMLKSKYLRKDDIEDDTPATIKKLSLEDMPGDSGDQRWVLSLRGLDKGMVLNATTLRMLAKAFGDESDDWIGKRVCIYVDPNVSFKGQVVGGLRLRPIGPKKSTPLVTPSPAAEEFDDRIP
jgi:hypothetical protein